jgi:FHA domain-containing protein
MRRGFGTCLQALNDVSRRNTILLTRPASCVLESAKCADRFQCSLLLTSVFLQCPAPDFMVNPHMRISVISFNGASPARACEFNFDTLGGAIGREEGNELVLPDPDRHISRVQARIEFDGANFLLVDQGGNPSAVNDRPVGKGNRVMLSGGDRIAIGAYVLEVEFDRQAPVFSTPAVASAGGADPLGLFGVPSSGGEDPFGGLFGAAEPARQAAAPAFSGGGSDDPFAVFAAPPRPVVQADTLADPFAPPPPVPRAPGADLFALSGGSKDASVDALFGLDAGGARDPFLGTPLGEPASVPAAGGAGAVDPLALFGGPAAAPPMASPQRDDASALNQAFTPPRAETPPAAGEMVFSWDRSPPEPEQALSASVPVTVLAAPAVRAEVSVDRVTPQLESAPVAVPAPASGAEQGALLEAFLHGLGVPLRLPAGLTPELMEQIGLVLRESTQGTLDLLTARALTKREVRAEVTMIVSKGNNPLKFSPDVGFALTQLLVPQGRGFMAPEEAMRDAYDDLRAHQFGFMAGMRAALNGVLKRFEPAALEQRVLTRSVLDSLLPGARKARLWDLFEQMYGDISREAEDDFHALFGREFLRAYEEQVERLQAERDPEQKA